MKVFPEEGDEIELRSMPEEGRAPVEVVIEHEYGPACVYMVSDPKNENRTGVVAIHPDGSWWWVSELAVHDDEEMEDCP